MENDEQKGNKEMLIQMTHFFLEIAHHWVYFIISYNSHSERILPFM